MFISAIVHFIHICIVHCYRGSGWGVAEMTVRRGHSIIYLILLLQKVSMLLLFASINLTFITCFEWVSTVFVMWPFVLFFVFFCDEFVFVFCCWVLTALMSL